jgi:hypothetical protein
MVGDELEGNLEGSGRGLIKKIRGRVIINMSQMVVKQMQWT